MNTALALPQNRLFPDLELPRWQKWSGALLLWTLPGLAALSYYYLNQIVAGQPISWRYALVSTLPWWYTWAVMTPFVLGVARRFPLRRENAVRVLVTAYLPMMVVLLAVHALVSLLLFRITGIHDTMNSALLQVHFTSRMHVNAVAFWTILGFYYAYDYYRHYQIKERQSQQLELQLAQANLRALKMQLNPHFLFNTLNSVAALVRKDENSTAIKMIGRLGEFLRLALESEGTPEVPLEQELDFLDRYLEIEKIRFKDRLVVRKNIGVDAENILVPNFILQPIVENAIHHAIAPHSDAGAIEIDATVEGDSLRIQVSDDGPGLKEGSLSKRGVGLSNTAERLERLYGGKQKLGIFNRESGGLTVEIVVPANTISS